MFFLILFSTNVAMSMDEEADFDPNAPMTLPMRAPSSGGYMESIQMDPCYQVCCPAINKEEFAGWLAERKAITFGEYSLEDAITDYATYLTSRHKKSLQEILKGKGENPENYSQEINKILPIFQEMYPLLEPIIFIYQERNEDHPS